MPKFFAFTEVVTTTQYHTLIIDADTAEEAELIAKQKFNDYLWWDGEEQPPPPAALMTYKHEVKARIKPVQPHHNVPD